MTNKLTFTAWPMLVLVLAACSNDPYEPILDGPRTAQFQSDLATCRQVSLQKPKESGAATKGAVIGGLIGGAEAGNSEDILAGAVVGSVLGPVEAGADLEKARKQIVFNCLRGRGHNVVG